MDRKQIGEAAPTSRKCFQGLSVYMTQKSAGDTHLVSTGLFICREQGIVVVEDYYFDIKM